MALNYANSKQAQAGGCFDAAQQRLPRLLQIQCLVLQYTVSNHPKSL